MPIAKPIVDLPELNSPANADKFFINDASDDTDSEEGSSKAITWESLVIAILASITWGDIGGDLADQTDLQDELDSKLEIKPRVGTIASTGSLTIDVDSYDQYTVTALAAALTINAPTGTPGNGQKLIIRLKDNATARALTFNAAFRFSSDLAAPTTTVVSKTMYLGFAWNSADSKWDCLAIMNNF